MSLIVADRFDNYITIWSDAKITFTGGYSKNENKEVIDIVEKYGCLKTYIIDNDICVSFAGEWEYMNKFIEWFISVVDIGCSIHNIISKLISLNIESKGETDFILSLLHTEDSHIIKIQNGEYSDCPTAWIGDYDGFRLYQEEKFKLQQELENINAIDSVREYLITKTVFPQSNGGTIGQYVRALPNNIFSDIDFTKWYAARYIAFKKVVESTYIPTVGKFINEILTSNQHKFIRPTEFCSKQKLPQQLKQPLKKSFTFSVPTTGNSPNGDFSYRIAPIENNRGLRVDIAEISKTIKYDICQYPNSDFNLLLLPRVFSLDRDISNAKSITIGPNNFIDIPRG